MIRVAVRVRRGGFRLELDVETQERVLGIYGPSGSGKTTLLHAVAGLERIDASAVTIDGAELAGPGGRGLAADRRRLALVPQDPLLFPNLSVRGNLLYAPASRETLASADGARIVELLRLAPLMTRRVGSLSGGESRRISLGRALLALPRALLLDEPTASLDDASAREVLALLIESSCALSIPMLIVSHRPAELVALGGTCVVLDEGRAVDVGDPAEVIGRSAGHVSAASLDNVVFLERLDDDEVGGLARLDLGGGEELLAPAPPRTSGRRLAVGLFSHDVVLSRARATGLSARNVVPATVERLVPYGGGLVVVLRAGETVLRASLTRHAAEEMGLGAGDAVHAIFKSTACRVLGLEGAPLPPSAS